MVPTENVGAGLHVVNGGAADSAATSGTYVAGTETTGTIIDRNALPRGYDSMKVAVPFAAIVSSGKSAALNLRVRHRNATSGAGSTWQSAATSQKAISRVGSTTTFNGRDIAALDVNLRPLGRYIKVNKTKTFNSTATGAAGAALTAEAITLAFGGANENRADGL